MTLRQELVNMVAVSAAKANRYDTRKDFELCVCEMAQRHNRLANYLDSRSSRQWKLFMTAAHDAAVAFAEPLT